MKRSRVSIAGLMGVVALVALGAVALRESTDLWASGVFTLTLCVLGLACLGAAFRRGASQAAFAGFASFGLGYFFLVYGPWASTEIRPHLATTKLIDYAVRRLLGEQVPRAEILYDLLVTGKNDGSGVALLDYDRDGTTDLSVANGTAAAKPGRSVASFERIGHSLFALAFGVAGGIAARYFRITATSEPGTPRSGRVRE